MKFCITNVRAVPYIPSVILLREKVTPRCDILGKTYRIRTKHFLHQLREIYYSSQTINDQPHLNIQLPNTTYSH